MHFTFRRLTPFLLVIFLLTSLTSAFAQGVSEEVVEVRIDGSLLMEDLVRALTDGFSETAPDLSTAFDIATNGPNLAFESFCNGDIDLVMSSRFITDDELAACEDVDVIENLVAFDGLVAVTSPSIHDGTACLSLPQLDQLYGLPAEGSETDVQQLDPAAESAPLQVLGPEAGSHTADLLRIVLPGGELRTDLETYAALPDVVEALTSEDPAAIAVMTLTDFEGLGESASGLETLEMLGETGNCYAPTLPNFETRSYPAQISLMLYVNADRAEDNALNDFLQYLSSEAGAPQIAADAGFTPASPASYSRNLNNLNQRTTGRTFSRATSPVIIDSTTEGEVTIAGSPQSGPLVDALTANFTTEFANATVNSDLFGTAAAWDALCSGEADAIFTIDAEEVTCETSETSTYDAEIGTQATVFAVAADADELPVCISVDALATAFVAPSPEADEIPLADERETARGALTWNELDPSFPDTPLTVFLPGRSSPEVDEVFAAAGLQNAFDRSDDEDNVFYAPRANRDPGRWRAAAVANLDAGGLAVLNWNDYDGSEHQADLRLLEVDDGTGCVAPDETTFADGSYPFATSFSLHLSREAMSDPVVAAFMWSLLSEDGITRLEGLDMVSTAANDLRNRRDDVFDLISEAQEMAAAQAEAEAETEATEEPEVTATDDADAQDVDATVAPDDGGADQTGESDG